MDLNVNKSPESDKKEKDKKDKAEKKTKSAPTSTGAVISANVETGDKDSSPRKDEKKTEDKPKKDVEVSVDVKAVENVEAPVEGDGSQTPKDKKRRKKRDAEGEKKDETEVKAGDDKPTTDETKEGGEVKDEGVGLTKEERKEEREKRRKEKKEREEKEAKEAKETKEVKEEVKSEQPKEKKHNYSHIKCVTKNFLFWKIEIWILISNSRVGSKVRAMFDYTAADDTELSFNADDFITVIKNDGSIPDWVTGELNGKVGLFPANYIEAGRFCVVLFEFVAENEDELTIQVRDRVKFIWNY